MAVTNADAGTGPADDTAPPPAAKRRRRQALLAIPAGRAGDEWMLTYMDTVTLLVTLFVMILSFASFNRERFAEFTAAMSLSKYRAGGMQGILGKDGKAVRRLVLPPPSSKPSMPAPNAGGAAGEGLLASLQGQIDRQGLTGAVKLRRGQGRVEMEINENVLFPLGSAELSASGLSLLSRLTDMLKAHPGRFSVEGHTDNLPIATDRFPSNWELSGARASAVVRRLVAGGIPAARLRIVGYAATRPLAGNDTAEARQKNRRVNIIVELPEAPTR